MRAPYTRASADGSVDASDRVIGTSCHSALVEQTCSKRMASDVDKFTACSVESVRAVVPVSGTPRMDTQGQMAVVAVGVLVCVCVCWGGLLAGGGGKEPGGA